MAKKVTIYNVFIATPSDLKEERNVIEEIADEINLSTYFNSEVRIEIKKWETHATPDIDDYSQQVINKSINDEYDIFVGILWSRFGSPTNSYKSGTEEEFYRAYNRYKNGDSSLKILFYFKQAPIPFELIDTNSIELIRKFKSEIGNKGSLYWEYSTIDEFQKLIRIHLTRKIQELVQAELTQLPVTFKPENIKSCAAIDDSDLGILDYIEIGDKSFKDTEEILFRMVDAINWIGKRFNERTEEINQHLSLNPQLSNNTKKRLINAAAEDILSFNKRLSNEIPLFSQTFKAGIDGFSNAINLSYDLDAEDKNEIENVILIIDTLIGIISNSQSECIGFRNSIFNSPRMTKEYNQAKRLASETLTELITEFQSSINLMEALKVEFEEYKRKMY